MKILNTFLTRKNLLIINILLIIIVILLLFFLKMSTVSFNNIIKRDNDKSYVFTSPILDCELENQNENAVVFSDNVSEKVNDLKSQYSLSHVSLYFRDLNNGPWIGINEKEVFSPASLLKVPILMAFLNQAEKDPSILNKKVFINQKDIDSGLKQNIKPIGGIVANKDYTLEQVAREMIEKSDNTAISVILRSIDTSYIEEVFKSVGVPYKDLETEVNVRVKDYAGFFRVLFNSSYLNRDMSEKALEILSKSEYKSGLVSGVPNTITVAHKFGERSVGGINGEKQFHDCGIIYYPNKPYILCIMTRGGGFAEQEKVISSLSAYFYNEVDKNKY